MKLLSLAIGLLISITAHSHIEVVHQLPQDRVAPYLEMACDITGGECPDEPEVLYTPTPVGLYGFQFSGTPYVFITDRCLYDKYEDTVMCKAVILHEMVHYVVGMQGRYIGNSCANEQLAWSAYNMYVLDNDRPDLVNLNWRRAYGGCK